MRSLVSAVVAAALLAGPVAACSAEPRDAPLADGLSAVVDQGRMQRQGREMFVRVSNETGRDVAVTALTLRSNRASDVSWTGSEDVEAGYDADVDVRVPRGRCGRETRFTVTLTYRVDGSEPVRSTVEVEDRYGAVTRVLDADCARTTLETAARLDVGRPVEDAGALRVPVTLTPRSGSTEVRLVGYGPTPLVRPTDDSATDVLVGGTDARGPVHADLVLEPARCDPHAIAEDKVGRLVPVEVSAPGLPDGTTFTLPLDRARRAAILTYVRSACGLD